MRDFAPFHDHRLGTEGYVESRWILLDYGDVVIHLFEPEARDYYALDHLWGTAKRVPFDAEAAAKGLTNATFEIKDPNGSGLPKMVRVHALITTPS